MGVSRVLSGTAPSAAVLNQWADEIDRLGIGCLVRRTTTYTNCPANTDLLVPWQTASLDTFAGTDAPMWTPSAPNYVTIRVTGVYAFTLVERWPASGGSAAGQRAGKIMLNGTSVFSNSISTGKEPADISTGEGTTVLCRATWPCYAGDLIYSNFWHSATGPVTALGVDYGGTYLAVNRRGPVIG